MVQLAKSVLASLRHLVGRLDWWQAVALTLGLAFGSLALAAAVVVSWPVDKFERAEAAPLWAHRHPVVRAGGLLAKNLLGYVTVALGVIMALPGVPGQGLLMILIGLTLLDFPGKRGLERRLVRRPAVHQTINRLRARFGRPPLALGEGPP
jgi:hypothetical protein